MFKQIFTNLSIYQKVKYIFLILFSLLVLQAKVFAQQTGSISGKITDKSNNEELIGANVLIVGTTIGASTDIDGTFNIKNLSEGNYTIKVSYISYNSVTVNNVVVKPGVSTRY